MLPAVSAAGSDAVVDDSFREMTIKIFGAWMLLLWMQNQDRLAEIVWFQVLVLCSCCGCEILALLRTAAGQWELEKTSKKFKDGIFFSFRIS